MHPEPREFYYRIPWRVNLGQPGTHRARLPGGSGEIQGLTTLLRAADHRRIDIRASSRDPFGELWFRTFRQRTVTPIYLLADLSRSMRFSGHTRKLELLAAMTRSTAYSANRSGDPFGFIGCDSTVRQDWFLPPGWQPAAADVLAQRLGAWQPDGVSAEGLLAGTQLLGQQRALVFLVSDFHFPLALLRRILDRLSNHAVVPVVIWDRAEYPALPRRGLAWVQDPESGRSRLLVLRAALRERIAQAFEQRWERLRTMCTQQGCKPVLLQDTFDPDVLTRYFHA